MKYRFAFIFILMSFFSNAQEIRNAKKTLFTKKTNVSPKIDGILNDAAWQNVEVAKDFIMFQPGNGNPEYDNQKTEVKVTYDDEAIYIAAYLYDDDPTSIPMQYGGRDSFGQADFFGVALNPNNDGQNETLFFVMSTGAQADAKATINNEDFSWSAVWDSESKIVDDGWIVEMKIPYSALRFSNQKVQTWGINFHRRMQDTKEQFSWNFIDKTKGNIGLYAGLLKGIENIQPPTRLSFSPYASSNISSINDETSFDRNIGLDVKYGISESFTLDATLIPDFGQAAFDDIVLNLGPFEQQYEEQRAFFTEGTELFNKGRLFYSRRIGNTPVGFYDVEDQLNDNEEILDNPNKVNMLNAVKVSGRTQKGLGIGVFNAITEKTEASAINNITGKERKIVTEPLANYNVLVLDQQFNKNSSISFVNTNVLRNGDFRDANVSGLLYNISNKSNSYRFLGNLKMSTINEFGQTRTGYSTFAMIKKTSGKIQYDIGHFRNNKNYEIKDLGFQRRNNNANYFGEISYRIFEPTKHFNQFNVSLEWSFRYLNNPNVYTGNLFEIGTFAMTKKNLAFGTDIEFNIGNQNDYFEARTEGQFFVLTPRLIVNTWFSTDYNKRFALDMRIGHGFHFNETSRNGYVLNMAPRYRVNNKLLFVYEFDYKYFLNQKGYVSTLEDDSIIFGNRDFKSITNSLTGTYNFTVKSGLSLSFRHYWSPVQYDSQFFQLEDNGYLSKHSYTENHDINFNSWNIDFSYSWQFAPGSQLIALYRNSIFNEDQMSHLSFNENLSNLLDKDMNHTLSLKLIYFIDYNNLKKWL